MPISTIPPVFIIDGHNTSWIIPMTIIHMTVKHQQQKLIPPGRKTILLVTILVQELTINHNLTFLNDSPPSSRYIVSFDNLTFMRKIVKKLHQLITDTDDFVDFVTNQTSTSTSTYNNFHLKIAGLESIPGTLINQLTIDCQLVSQYYDDYRRSLQQSE